MTARRIPTGSSFIGGAATAVAALATLLYADVVRVEPRAILADTVIEVEAEKASALAPNGEAPVRATAAPQPAYPVETLNSATASYVVGPGQMQGSGDGMSEGAPAVGLLGELREVAPSVGPQAELREVAPTIGPQVQAEFLDIMAGGEVIGLRAEEQSKQPRFIWKVEGDGAALTTLTGGEPPDGDSASALGFTGKGRIGGGVEMTVRGRMERARNVNVDEVLGFQLGPRRGWREGAVQDTEIAFSMMGGRLRTKTRHSVSNFASSRRDGDEVGNAVAQRVEADLVRAGDLSFGAWGAIARATADYRPIEDVAEPKRSKRKDKGRYPSPGEVEMAVGAKASYGPVGLSLARTDQRMVSGPDEGRRAMGYTVGATLDVETLRWRSGAGDAMLWEVLPDSLWANYETSDVSFAGDGAARADISTNYTAGASWVVGPVQVDGSYWRSTYDNRRMAGDEGDWRGDGLDVSASYYADQWAVSAGVSSYSSRSSGRWSRASDDGVGGWVSLSLTPENAPGLSLGVSLDQYDGGAVGWRGGSDELEITAIADFSRYVDLVPKRDEALNFVIRYSDSRSRDSGPGYAVKSSEDDVFVGLRYQSFN